MSPSHRHIWLWHLSARTVRADSGHVEPKVRSYVRCGPPLQRRVWLLAHPSESSRDTPRPRGPMLHPGGRTGLPFGSNPATPAHVRFWERDGSGHMGTGALRCGDRGQSTVADQRKHESSGHRLQHALCCGPGCRGFESHRSPHVISAFLVIAGAWYGPLPAGLAGLGLGTMAHRPGYQRDGDASSRFGPRLCDGGDERGSW